MWQTETRSAYTGIEIRTVMSYGGIVDGKEMSSLV